MYSYPGKDYKASDRLLEEATVDWPDSLVIEDSSLTLREIVERSAEPFHGNFYPDDNGYDDDVDFENVPLSEQIQWDRLDMAELTEVRQILNARIAELHDSEESSSAPSGGSGGEQSPETKQVSDSVPSNDGN